MSSQEDPRHNSHVAKRPKLSRFISDSEIRSEFSHHQPGIARINNGSFGSCPNSIIVSQQKYQLRFLQQPDDFYFNHLRSSILRSRVLIKNLINADDVSEVSLVDNATTAAAIVLQQIGRKFADNEFSPGDSVLMLHCAYQAVKKSLQAYVTRAGGKVIEVHLPFPVRNDSEIVDEFRKALERGRLNGRRVRLAIIDHITSMPSVVVPVKELVRICREEGVDKVFVDAAHAIGSAKVDVKDIGADYYVSNLHKWLFCPPSVAVLYCRKSLESNQLHHPVVSHEFGNGLPIESSWIGTRDYSAQLVIPDALEFVDRFEGGVEGIMKRNHEKVVEMGKMLVEAWGTNLGAPEEMCASMVMVGLPPRLGVFSDEDALRLRSYLRSRYGVEVPIHYQPMKDGEDGPRDRGDGMITAYGRISHQVYNIAEDYFKFRDAVTQMVEDGLSCKVLQAE